MKKSLAFLVILLVLGAIAYAQSVVFYQDFSTSVTLPKSQGDWRIRGGRLYQNDAEERLAKMNVMARQSGEMQYEFNVRYENGAQDLMGGFGIHVFVNNPWDGKSWGNGDSFLLWLNYDPAPTYGPKGFTAQVYRSTSATKMEIVGHFDLNDYAYLLSTENLGGVIPVRLKINGATGSVWVESPMQPGYGWSFSLGTSLGTGNYVALRTNNLAASFDNLKVTKLN